MVGVAMRDPLQSWLKQRLAARVSGEVLRRRRDRRGIFGRGSRSALVGVNVAIVSGILNRSRRRSCSSEYCQRERSSRRDGGWIHRLAEGRGNARVRPGLPSHLLSGRWQSR